MAEVRLNMEGTPKPAKKRGGKNVRKSRDVMECSVNHVNDVQDDDSVGSLESTAQRKKGRFTLQNETSTLNQTPPPLESPVARLPSTKSKNLNLSKTKKKGRGKKDSSKLPHQQQQQGQPQRDPNIHSENVDENHATELRIASGSDTITEPATTAPAATPPQVTNKENASAPGDITPYNVKKVKRKGRIIIRDPIDISAIEDNQPETEEQEEKENEEGGKETKDEEEVKFDPATIDFQTASTSRALELHTSSGRRTKRIRYVIL